MNALRKSKLKVFLVNGQSPFYMIKVLQYIGVNFWTGQPRKNNKTKYYQFSRGKIWPSCSFLDVQLVYLFFQIIRTWINFLYGQQTIIELDSPPREFQA